MELEYVVADPTGNITALILTPVTREMRPRVAAALMKREADVEQAGFLRLTDSGVELSMAGGEFCGNAAMSAAAVYASGCGLGAGEKISLPVRVSGAPETVRVELEALANGGFFGMVEMPRPLSVGRKTFVLDGEKYFLPLVSFPGITHIIAPFDMDTLTAERAAREWCALLNEPALGMMLFDRKRCRLKPLVYVPGTDTMLWEHSCASGTAAVGIWQSLDSSRVCTLVLKEPGGTLGVKASFLDRILVLGGHVRLRARKIAEEDEN